MRRSFPFIVCLSLGLFAAACDSSPPTDNPMGTDDAGDQADLLVVGDDAGPNGAVSTVYPAPFQAPPQVALAGGPVLDAPRFVPVYFANDDSAVTTQVTDFISRVGATKYWAATTAEYGVGPATATAPVKLAEAAPAMITSAAIEAWLAAKLNANDPAFPKTTPNTIYVLVYPTVTTITQPNGAGIGISCQNFGGYHSNVKLDIQHSLAPVAYAVIPRCDSFGDLTGLDAVTGTMSHELIEAVTDPYPQANPAYSMVDSDHLYWTFVLGGGEVGDMCAQDPKSFTTFPELPYVVQRSWSNQAATAGHNPCVPALPGEAVYFNAVPELNDMITIFQSTIRGVAIPVGESRVVPLDLFSDGSTGGPFTVKVVDTATLLGTPATLAFALDRKSGQNGEKLNLTITVKKANQYGIAAFMVTSTLGKQSHIWIGAVAEQ